jgi:tetratricopeptide (TPR) repeat protein
MIRSCISFVFALALGTGAAVGQVAPLAAVLMAFGEVHASMPQDFEEDDGKQMADDEGEGDSAEDVDEDADPASKAFAESLVQVMKRSLLTDPAIAARRAEIDAAEEALARGELSRAEKELRSLDQRIYDPSGAVSAELTEIAVRSSVAQGWIAANRGKLAEAKRFYLRALDRTGIEAALDLASPGVGGDTGITVVFTSWHQMLAARKLALLMEQMGDALTAEFLRSKVEEAGAQSMEVQFKNALFGEEKPWIGLRARLREQERELARNPAAGREAAAAQRETIEDTLKAIQQGMQQSGRGTLTPDQQAQLIRNMEELNRATRGAVPAELLPKDTDAQDPEQAIKSLRESLESYRASEQFDMAVQALKTGRLYRAEALFRGVILELDLIEAGKVRRPALRHPLPTKRNCYIGIARCRERWGDLDGALRALDEAAVALQVDAADQLALQAQDLSVRSRLLLGKGDTKGARDRALDALNTADRNWESALPSGTVGAIADVLAGLPSEPSIESARVRSAAAVKSSALRAVAEATALTEPESALASYMLAVDISRALIATDPLEALDRSEVGGQALGAGVVRQQVAKQVAAQLRVVGGRTAAEDRADLAESLLGVATILIERRMDDDVAAAGSALAEAIAIARRQGHESQYVMETRFGNLLLDQGRDADAAQFFLNAIEELQWRRRQLVGEELSRASQMSELRRVADPFEGYVRSLARSVGDGDAASVLRAIALARGQAFRDLLMRAGLDPVTTLLRQVQQFGDATLATEVQDAMKARADAATEAAAIERELRDAKLPVEVKSQRFARLLEVQDAQLAATDSLFTLLRRTVREKAAVTRSDFVPAEGECLLAYQFGPQESWVVLSSPSGTSAHRLHSRDGKPATVHAVRAIVDRLVSEYADPTMDRPRLRAAVTEDESALGGLLVPPAVLAALRSSDVAIIVPDGPIVGFPFEALRLPFGGNDARRWVEDGPPTMYAVSPPVGGARRTSLPAEGSASLVAIGVDDFGGVGGGVGAGGAPQSRELAGFGPLASLPAAVPEVKLIGKLWSTRHPRGVTKILVGKDARYSEINRVVRSPTVLHVATHGFSIGGSRIGESCVVVSRTEEDAADRIRLRELLSDWSGRLAGTQLVVLSACETAKGKDEVGEGAIALTWGFMHAGAGNVLATRWNASDQGSFLLMRRFYENYLGLHEDRRVCGRLGFERGAGMPPAMALAEARNWLRKLTAVEIDRASEETRGIVEHRGAKVDLAEGGGPFDHPWYWGLLELTTRPEG